MRENFMCIVSSQYVKQFYIHNTYIQRNTGIEKILKENILEY